MTTAPGRPTQVSATQALNQALALYQRNQFAAALDLTERLIAALPPSAQVLNLASACAKAVGSLQKAESYARAAVDAQPDYTNARNRLGVLLMESRRYAEAEAEFRRVLEIEPNGSDTWVNLGNLCRTTGRESEAEDAYRRALAIQGRHIDALYNLGLLLYKRGRLDEAEAAFRQSLQIQPNQADVYNDLGNLLTDTLRHKEAEAAYRQATKLSPRFADAYLNLGTLLLDSKRLGEALAVLRRARELQPGRPDIDNCLGNLLTAAGNATEAELAYRQALKARPDSANVHNNLGNLLMAVGRLDEAEAAYREAVRLQPDYGHALGQAVTCAAKLFSWAQGAGDSQAVMDALERGTVGIPSLLVLSLPEADGKIHRRAAFLASKAKLEPYLSREPLHKTVTHQRGERLRIGYLSADFREHAVMHLLGGVLEAHDRSRFEIHAYHVGPNQRDAYRERAERACEFFHDAHALSDEAVAERIAADGIHILVDLNGNTQNVRLGITALRPAPVVVNWLGYPGSLGHRRLADYIVGDPVVTPVEHAEHFAETIAQLPHCYLPNDSQRPIGMRPSRSEEGLPEDAVVFCSFNQGHKLNPPTFDLWCRILREVPGSVLWLNPAAPPAIANLRREAEARGVAAERLVFAGRKPTAEEHLGRLQLADLALDTFPYTSHTTGCDALWAGVPLITLMGDTFVSRVAASLLNTLGLPELVTRNREDYCEVACRLGLDEEARRAVREKLAAARLASPLFDTQGFTRNLENLYSAIWRNHCEGAHAPILAEEGVR